MTSVSTFGAPQSLRDLDTEAKDFIEKQYQELSLEQKIGQLFMVAAYSEGDKYDDAGIQNLIKNHHIGGIIFMQGTAESQAQLTTKYQNMSQIPLFIAMDAEWGVGMRLKGVKDLAKNIQIGASRNPALAAEVGSLIAEQCKRLGVHINFGPVVDINNNPNNPVINFRSFGENKENVTSLGRSYAGGLESNGVMSCTKHFPGHGDTDVDSHKDLPSINKSYDILWQNELYPFRMLKDVSSSTMIAHLTVPSITHNASLPTTLSYDCITQLLKGKIGFEGLVFTDALNMQGVAKYYGVGEVDYKAFLAGNDVLLFSQSVPKAVALIKQGIQSGKISEERLRSSVMKILAAKYKFGAFDIKLAHQNGGNHTRISSSNATSDLNKNINTLNKKIAEASITLCRDDNKLFEKKSPASNILYVSLGTAKVPKSIIQSTGIKTISLSTSQSTTQMQSYLSTWKKYDKVILGIHGVHKYPGGSYGLSSSLKKTAKYLAEKGSNVALLINGNPYAAKYFCGAKTVIVNYQETSYNLEASIEAILGNIPFRGKLPVSVCTDLPEGTGIVSASSSELMQNQSFQESKIKYDQEHNDLENNRAKAVIPKSSSAELSLAETTRLAREKFQQEGGKMDVSNKYTRTTPQLESPKNTIKDVIEQPSESIEPSKKYNFSKIDQMISGYINRGVFPGCQVLVAKGGRVVHYKSYGHHTYVGLQPVKNNDVYDIASVTKITATTLAIMKLYEEGKIDLDANLGQYLPMTRNTNKQNISLRRLLLHEAGLVAWIPFYKECMNEDNTYKPETLVNYKAPAYPIPVANNLYIHKDYPQKIWQEILDSEVGARRYRYSDLDFLFLQKVVEAVSGQSIDQYVDQNFYKPLGLTRIGYSPKVKHWISPTSIVPTEKDDYFRMQLIDGYVHDQCAAMLGGVAGHAGLFSDASSMFVILQMLLNGGEFSGKKYLNKSTIDLFTKKSSHISRRGLGFDKPERQKSGGPTGDICSASTFGHQGFTGTCVWADPKDDVVFIFLSNRVYPTAENKLIGRLDVRTKLQDECYKILGL